MSSNASRGGDTSLKMSVDNISFLIDRLGEDCAPLQFLRELTQNSIEAINRAGGKGTITWDVDWNLHDLGDLMKLCVIDTGDGMIGPEMLKFINQLSSSGSEQSLTANYGIGAKIAAATRNPAGVQYQSWKDGEGALIHLEKGATGQYGLRQFELSNGEYQHWLPIDDDIKPKEIKQHGTKVILLGRSEKGNTMTAPAGTASKSRWVSKYLNTRYFDIPKGITIKVREGWKHPREDKDRNYLRKITGQKNYLDQHAQTKGTKKLADAKAHWWILKDDKALTSNSGVIESTGHMAALYQNELYDRYTTRAAIAQLQHFGILFGSRFVIIYVEPTEKESLTTNTARTTLLLNGEQLPWAEWAHEFRESMPKQLVEFVQEKAAGSAKSDHEKSIRQKLRPIIDLYKVSRYKPEPKGRNASDDAHTLESGLSDHSGQRDGEAENGCDIEDSTEAPGVQEGLAGDIYHLFEKKSGTPAETVRTDPFPVVRWVRLSEGTREQGDMEDRAAKYIPEQNTLLINSDFRVFRDITDRLCQDKGGSFAVRPIVEDSVHAWFELALVEVVIGIQQLKGSKEWSLQQIEQALSEEALTASAMQRYHVHNVCKRELGMKFARA